MMLKQSKKIPVERVRKSECLEHSGLQIRGTSCVLSPLLSLDISLGVLQSMQSLWSVHCVLILQVHTVPAYCYKAKDLQPLIIVMYTKGIPSPVNVLLFGVPVSISHVEG